MAPQPVKEKLPSVAHSTAAVPVYPSAQVTSPSSLTVVASAAPDTLLTVYPSGTTPSALHTPESVAGVVDPDGVLEAAEVVDLNGVLEGGAVVES